MSDHYRGEQVQCNECGTWYRLKRGPVELFGSEVWYPFEKDAPGGQIIIRDGEVLCHSCGVQQYSDELPRLD